jgi:transcriptional regulator with XRE-family HTH domain
MVMAGKRKQGTNALPFAKILKQIMSDRDLTVRAIAEMAGASASVVQSWVSGANPHDLQAVGRLSKALGMTLEELILGQNTPKHGAREISDFFDEQDLFEGICKISIKKLNQRKGKT